MGLLLLMMIILRTMINKMTENENTMPLIRKKCGFTLMEMIIVISIIIILAGISVPVFIAAVKRDKYSGSARTVQALLMKAKKLAIQERAVVSVEFYYDSVSNKYYMQLLCKNGKDNGTATNGAPSNTTLEDSTKNWAANKWQNGKVYVYIDGSTLIPPVAPPPQFFKYSSIIRSNGTNALTFDALSGTASVSNGCTYWLEGALEKLAKDTPLEDGIMFAFTDADWKAKHGWVGTSYETDNYPDIAFLPEGVMADVPEEGQIVIKPINSTDPNEKIIITVNKLTGFVGTSE